MNVIKRLISGNGSGAKEKKKVEKHPSKHQKKHHRINNNNNNYEEYDYEREHCEVDFDKHFEQATRRNHSYTVPPPIISESEYRGSQSSRGTPMAIRSNSKSSSPFGQHPPPLKLLVKQESQGKKNSSLGTPTSHRKSSEPNWKTRSRQKSPQEHQPMGNDKVKRNLTDSQKRKAKDLVESIDWIQAPVTSGPADPQVCYASSVQPQIAQSQMIVPQIHICEVLPITRPGNAKAIIPQGKGRECLQPVIASGKVVSATIYNNQKP